MTDVQLFGGPKDGLTFKMGGLLPGCIIIPLLPAGSPFLAWSPVPSLEQIPDDIERATYLRVGPDRYDYVRP